MTRPRLGGGGLQRWQRPRLCLGTLFTSPMNSYPFRELDAVVLRLGPDIPWESQEIFIKRCRLTVQRRHVPEIVNLSR